MADLEGVKARIRALMERTQDRGCTEAEALVAAAKVLELMRVHQLTETAVQCGRAVKPLGRAKRNEVDRIWAYVALAARCEGYYESDEQLRMVYVGRLPWPDVAGYLHDLVAGAAGRATRDYCKTAEYKRRRTAKTKRQAREAFQAGFVTAMASKLRALVDAEDPAFRKDCELAAAALAEVGGLRKIAPRKSPGLQPRYSGAVTAGHLAGRDTKVGWGVGGPAATRLIGHDG